MPNRRQALKKAAQIKESPLKSGGFLAGREGNINKGSLNLPLKREDCASHPVQNPNWDDPGRDCPNWYQGGSPFGSAIRYIAGLSSSFQWVGIYTLKPNGQKELGPFIGDAVPSADFEWSSLTVEIGKTALLEVQGSFLEKGRFDRAEEQEIRRVAHELEEFLSQRANPKSTK